MPELDSLSGIRVLEIGGQAVEHCGRLLADLGAEVIKVEPPNGALSRSLAPFAGDVVGSERSLYFLNANSNKKSVILDLTDEEDRVQLKNLISRSDVVLEDFIPGHLASLGLGFDSLAQMNQNIVLTSVTGFGQIGPFAKFESNDLVAGAMGGIMSIQGDPDYPPCNTPLELGYQLAGVHGAVGTLAALFDQRVDGNGCHVDVSIQDVIGHIQFAIHRYSMDYEITKPTERGVAGIEAYPTKDGWAHIYSRRWEWIVDWINDPVLNEPRWKDRQYRADNSEEAHQIIEEFTQKFTSIELMEQGQERGIPIAPLNSMEDFAKSLHLRERGFFKDAKHPVIGDYRYPGPPYILTETPVRVHDTAPLLGEHDSLLDQILSEPPKDTRRRPARSKEMPKTMQDIRVLDFTIAFAGPYATRYLAELGAEVIKVESMKFAGGTSEAAEFRLQHPGGRTGNFNEINRSKRSVALDLHFAEAQQVALELVKKSDVVIDNFSPGTLQKWNLGYDDIKKVKPDIIMVEMPGFGSSGPYGHYVSLGQTLTSYCGMMRLWGHPSSPENMRSKIAHPDWVAAAHSVTAILASLYHRDQTGLGQYIELPQIETAATMMGAAFLDYFVNGRVAEPIGNHHSSFAPYNSYPCEGDNRWCVIAVETDKQWKSLIQVTEINEWADDPRFKDRFGRKSHEMAIDKRLSEWTRSHSPSQIMYLLQKVGVPAGLVQDAEDLYRDYHLREKGYLVEVDQPFTGRVVNPGATIRLGGLPEVKPRGAPFLGQDNEYVYSELLGLSAKTIKEYTDQGIFV